MLVIKKRSIIIFSALILTVIAFIVCFGSLSALAAGETSASGIKIVLDAGHGGIDGGVTGVNTGVKESEINLAIVRKLEKYLTEAGFGVVLTRTSEAGLYGVATGGLKKKDMQKRSEIINSVKPDIVVSVHQNKYSVSSRRGAQVFYKKGDGLSEKLAGCIQNSINDIQESVKNYKPLTGDYYILNCSDYPSVIAECGFLSNPIDESLLITEEYQQKIAYSIFKGIVSYLTETSAKFGV